MRYYDCFFGTIENSTKEECFDYCEGVFFAASNKEILLKAVKMVKGRCAKSTLLKKIKMGVKQKFRAGDPIEFWGKPVGVVKVHSSDFLKIQIRKNVFFYSEISYTSNKCLFLQVVK